jgi:hypothetical protein
LAKGVGDIVDEAVIADDTPDHPFDVFLNIGCVDTKEVFLVPHLIDDQVIDHTAVRIAHDGVEGLADFQARHIVGDKVVQVGQGILPMDPHFTHMADIEQAGLFPDSPVFLKNGGVLDGHFPSGERHHASPMLNVKRVKGRTSQVITHRDE